MAETRGGRPPNHQLPPPTGPIVRQASGEQAAAYIRQLIFEGELRQGARLPQDQIAKALGLSRIPVREAVVALEREGWLTTELHRGAFVNALDEDTVRDHYELWGLVFGLAVRRTIARGDQEVAARLGQLARQVAATDVPREVQETALAFHNLVIKAAQSPRIRVVLKAMPALVQGPFFEMVPAAIPSEQRGLPAIARAVKKGDPARATDEYARMLREQGDAVVELFRARHLVARPESA